MKIKIFLLLVFISFLFCITSCRRHTKLNNDDVYPELIYQGKKYDLIQINDSMILLIPGTDASDNYIPHVVNLKKSELEE
jgi:hypothetical protein